MKGPTVTAVAILTAVVAFAFICFIKRFTSKQTCCGTQKVKSHRKKLKKVAGKVVFHVDGMHCNTCRSSVEKTVNEFEGLAAKVSLENKTLTVSYEPNAVFNPDEIIAALGEKGFTAKTLS